MKNFLFLLLLLGLGACKKDNASIPDSNEQGEYFNCKIDGKYWTYKQAYFTSHDDLTFRSYFNDAGYEITGENGVDFPQTVVSFRITRVDFPDKDTVELTSYSKGAVAQVNGPPPAELSSVEFYSDTLHTGRIIFTTRTPQRLEGTFQVDVYRS